MNRLNDLNIGLMINMGINESFTEAFKLLVKIQDKCMIGISQSRNAINNGTEFDSVDFRYEQGRIAAYKSILEVFEKNSQKTS